MNSSFLFFYIIILSFLFPFHLSFSSSCSSSLSRFNWFHFDWLTINASWKSDTCKRKEGKDKISHSICNIESINVINDIYQTLTGSKNIHSQLNDKLDLLFILKWYLNAINYTLFKLFFLLLLFTFSSTLPFSFHFFSLSSSDWLSSETFVKSQLDLVKSGNGNVITSMIIIILCALSMIIILLIALLLKRFVLQKKFYLQLCNFTFFFLSILFSFLKSQILNGFLLLPNLTWFLIFTIFKLFSTLLFNSFLLANLIKWTC